ncbi:Mur ligase domain-containing protein [Methylocystis parvus]|uniref:Mur ligase domain-containing protein n=1 Tax=Methylocystis parvus TaxID=134 RepID=UPI003C751C74
MRDLEISGLSADSRAIGEGFAFFAIPGHAGDGLSFVNDARVKGAVVVSRSASRRALRR